MKKEIEQRIEDLECAIPISIAIGFIGGVLAGFVKPSGVLNKF